MSREAEARAQTARYLERDHRGCIGHVRVNMANAAPPQPPRRTYAHGSLHDMFQPARQAMMVRPYCVADRAYKQSRSRRQCHR